MCLPFAAIIKAVSLTYIAAKHLLQSAHFASFLDSFLPVQLHRMLMLARIACGMPVYNNSNSIMQGRVENVEIMSFAKLNDFAALAQRLT